MKIIIAPTGQIWYFKKHKNYVQKTIKEKIYNRIIEFNILTIVSNNSCFREE